MKKHFQGHLPPSPPPPWRSEKFWGEAQGYILGCSSVPNLLEGLSLQPLANPANSAERPETGRALAAPSPMPSSLTPLQPPKRVPHPGGAAHTASSWGSLPLSTYSPLCACLSPFRSEASWVPSGEFWSPDMHRPPLSATSHPHLCLYLCSTHCTDTGWRLLPGLCLYTHLSSDPQRHRPGLLCSPLLTSP